MNSALVRISIMMFIQFFVWGTWFATVGQALGGNGLGDAVGGAYGTAPLGAIFAPLFLGLIADRFFASQNVMGVLFLIGGVLMWFAGLEAVAGQAIYEANVSPILDSIKNSMDSLAQTADAGKGAIEATLATLETQKAAAMEPVNAHGSKAVWFFLGHMLCYMPTLGLGNTIAFSNLDRLAYPKTRVWGTIGWIAAGLVVGFIGWSSSMNIFRLAAISSIIMGLYSFALPHTPPPAKGQKINLSALLMVDAWKLLAKPGFLIFIICSTLICVPLAYYFGSTGQYLSNAGFTQAASTMTIGQMSEIFFMLLIPFFFRRMGVKWMIIVGMIAWVLRYFLFAFGAPDQVVWMLLLGVALHGICYDFFFVTGYMYTDRIAPKEVRSQAQSMLVFLTQGIGMYIGYGIAFGLSIFGWKIYDGKFGTVKPHYNNLDAAIKEGREEETLSFGQQLLEMFSINVPDTVKPEVVSSAMDQWKDYWMFPAIIAAAITVIFFLTFWDKTKVGNEGDDEKTES
ncbi:MAG: hypothetical protein ACI8UO_002014 [Verrucomicrobiales bacterium]|jgi:hypothetical protein